jgi:excisionase family DNA binding protein
MQQPQENFTVAEPQALAYSIPAACKAAGVGRTKIYEALASGALRARKNGAKNLILRADLEHWLEALPTEKAAAPSPKPRLAPAA